jgi:hypothetical protein
MRTQRNLIDVLSEFFGIVAGQKANTPSLNDLSLAFIV